MRQGAGTTGTVHLNTKLPLSEGLAFKMIAAFTTSMQRRIQGEHGRATT